MREEIWRRDQEYLQRVEPSFGDTPRRSRRPQVPDERLRSRISGATRSSSRGSRSKPPTLPDAIPEYPSGCPRPRPPPEFGTISAALEGRDPAFGRREKPRRT